MSTIRALTMGAKHHFFGYYGVNAWDPSLRRHLALETDFDDHRPTADDGAQVGLVDRETGEFHKYAETRAFNLQQGSMMHWIDAGFGAEFTFNDWDGDALVSRAINPETRQVRTLSRAVAAISPVAPVGIGLNFARMSFCRPVVGYANRIDPAIWAEKPEDDGLLEIDLKTGESRLLLSIAEVVGRYPHSATKEGHVWFNHVYYNTDGTRMLFLCRVKRGDRFITSMWSMNADGSELKLQIDYGYHTSHFAWRDTRRIMISTDLTGDMQFLEFLDRERTFEPFGNGAFPSNGHNAFSPDRQWVVCDSSPKAPDRLAELMLYHIGAGQKISLGKFHHPPIYTGDIRCDLHPRWSPDGRAITFDSVHEGSRQIYLADVSDVVEQA